MKQSENCKYPSAPPPPLSRKMYILCINYSSNAYDMPIPRYIATLALMPKSALSKYWRYSEGALYMFGFLQGKKLNQLYICMHWYHLQ